MIFFPIRSLIDFAPSHPPVARLTRYTSGRGLRRFLNIRFVQGIAKRGLIGPLSGVRSHSPNAISNRHKLHGRVSYFLHEAGPWRTLFACFKTDRLKLAFSFD